MEGDVVRVRYAPSPTGKQHIGSVRTALFNWLYARNEGGRFILRVEDTDPVRSRPDYEQDLFGQLSWLGLTWDEGPDIGGPYGPYRSSERQLLYREAMQVLVERGLVYPCYCSPDELAEQRRQALASGKPPRYNGHCRDPQARESLRRLGRSPIFRFRVPEGQQIVLTDLIRREITYSSDDLGDFAIYRAADEQLRDGRAFYNLAVVVDDHAMAISHVLRGEEHLSNTPRQLLLYQALGYRPPRFGHLSLILTPDGAKMSKRFGDTSIEYYVREGYLPEALLAYVATLGWAPGRHPERNTIGDLIRLFDLRHVSASPAIFDPQRLTWFNQRALQRADAARISELVRPRLVAVYGRWHAAEGTAHAPEAWFALLVGAAREEATTLQDMVSLSAFALAPERPELAPDALEALQSPAAGRVLIEFLARLAPEHLETPERANAWLTDLRHALRDSDGLQGRQVMFPIRAALTGSLRGPCLGVVTCLLGAARCRDRAQEALSICQGAT